MRDWISCERPKNALELVKSIAGRFSFYSGSLSLGRPEKKEGVVSWAFGVVLASTHILFAILSCPDDLQPLFPEMPRARLAPRQGLRGKFVVEVLPKPG